MSLALCPTAPADVLLHHLLQHVDLIGRGSPMRGASRKAYLLVTIDESTFNRLCDWDTADDEDGHADEPDLPTDTEGAHEALAAEPPLTISEAKRRPAASLGIDISSIKIMIDT